MDVLTEFSAALAAAGISCHGHMIADGNLHRFKVDGDHNRNCWYVFYPDGVPSGAYGCWKRAISGTWSAKNGHEFTEAERFEWKRRMDDTRRQREAEMARERAEAAKKAAALLEAATADPATHPYGIKKRVSLGPLVKRGAWLQRGWPDSLLIPIYGGDGRVQSIEAINTDGDKDFLAGGKTAGGFHPLGKVRGASRVFIAEGVANAAVAAEVEQSPAVAALCAGNLGAVAKDVRDLAPEAEFIVIADNDIKPDGRNPGVEAAMEAARAVDGLMVIPELDGRKCDLWDVWNERGIDTVRDAIANAQAPAMGEHGPDTENAPGGAETSTEEKSKEAPKESDAMAFARLAKMSPAEYDRCREKEAKQLGIRVGTLDAEVCKARGETAEDTGQGQAFAIESPEPWPYPVNGAELLNDIAATYRRYVILPEHADIALALWTVHTYSYDYGRCTPILAITSPQKRCGKSTLMSALLAFVNKPLGASNISPSCVYRSIDRWQPTLLIDEADSFLKDNEELRGIINSGHTRELAYVIRNVGDDHEPRQFSTWCPKAIALIGKLPPTLHDRAIEIPLVRKTAGEPVHRLRELDGADIRRKSVRWVSDHASELREADPVVPPELHDRAADNWRPLLTIADLVDGEWPERARAAAKALSEGGDDAESSAVMLLTDIRGLFKDRKVDKLFSEDLVTHLHTLEDQPWPQWGRAQKPITKNQVARLLKSFKIKPGQIWNAGKNERGYELEQFTDAFSRYLPPIQTARPLDASSGAASGENQTARGKEFLADRNPPKPKPGAGSSGLADQKGGAEEREVLAL